MDLEEIMARFPILHSRLLTTQDILSCIRSSAWSKRLESREFVFIVGAGRSGNTLLRRLMMERFSLYIPPESYVLPRIARYGLQARGLKWPDVVSLVMGAFEFHDEFETFPVQSVREFALQAKKWPRKDCAVDVLIRKFYFWLASEAGISASWVGDKTPMNTMHLQRVSRLLPGAVYIFLIRDGVDVVQSYVKAGLYEDVEDAARRWVGSLKNWRLLEKQIPESRRVQIRYEDLVTEPDHVLQALGDKFGIPPSEGPVNHIEMGDVEKRMHHANVKKNPTRHSIGKGRKTLTPTDAEKIAPIMDAYLLALGYEAIVCDSDKS